MAGEDGRIHEGPEYQYAVGLARAFAGALIFAFPLTMTMEMWWIGFYIEPARLLVFLVLGLGLLIPTVMENDRRHECLSGARRPPTCARYQRSRSSTGAVGIIGLAYYSGFEADDDFLDAVLDGLTAYGVGFIGSGSVLWLLGVLTADLGWRGSAGMIAIQAIPAGIGASVARAQLGGARDEQAKKDRAGYPAQLFLMAAGAIFVAFNVAPTEEMILITFAMSPAQLIALMAFSILVLHALVYTVGFAGQEEPVAGAGFWTTFCTYTLAGYGLALLLSAYALWTFGRTDDASLPPVAMMAVVLGFPAALGAGIARLVV